MKKRTVSRPIRANLLRQLDLARKDLAFYVDAQKNGCDCAYQIKRSEAEIDKLEQLTK